MGWAARWNTTSGRAFSKVSRSLARSRMSPMTECISPAIPVCAKMLGSVGGSRAYPVT